VIRDEARCSVALAASKLENARKRCGVFLQRRSSPLEFFGVQRLSRRLDASVQFTWLRGCPGIKEIARKFTNRQPSWRSLPERNVHRITRKFPDLASPLYNQNNTSQFDETWPQFFDKTVCDQILEQISQVFHRVNLHRYLPSSAAHLDKPVPPTINILLAVKRIGGRTLLPDAHDYAFYWHNVWL
jgi:hypothetical protein